MTQHDLHTSQYAWNEARKMPELRLSEAYGRIKELENLLDEKAKAYQARIDKIELRLANLLEKLEEKTKRNLQ
jgi:hypothetical protein